MRGYHYAGGALAVASLIATGAGTLADSAAVAPYLRAAAIVAALAMLVLVAISLRPGTSEIRLQLRWWAAVAFAAALFWGGCSVYGYAQRAEHQREADAQRAREDEANAIGAATRDAVGDLGRQIAAEGAATRGDNQAREERQRRALAGLGDKVDRIGAKIDAAALGTAAPTQVEHPAPRVVAEIDRKAEQWPLLSSDARKALLEAAEEFDALLTPTEKRRLRRPGDWTARRFPGLDEGFLEAPAVFASPPCSTAAYDGNVAKLVYDPSLALGGAIVVGRPPLAPGLGGCAAVLRAPGSRVEIALGARMQVRGRVALYSQLRGGEAEIVRALDQRDRVVMSLWLNARDAQGTLRLVAGDARAELPGIPASMWVDMRFRVSDDEIRIEAVPLGLGDKRELTLPKQASGESLREIKLGWVSGTASGWLVIDDLDLLESTAPRLRCPGDMTSDDKVTDADVYALRAVIERHESAHEDDADCNGDGVVDGRDVLCVAARARAGYACTDT